MLPIKINPIIVSQNITTIRKRKNIKASEIAKRIQMSESNYTKYERGEVNITLEFLNQVAETLEVRVIDLLVSSPDNIFENIYKSYNVEGSDSISINQNTISALQNQLQIKDEQINKLLEIIKNQKN